MNTLLGLLGAYLLGCIASGYYLTRWRTGRDVRAIGSGTSGAFNSARLLGWPGFGLVVALDLAKGAAAVLLAQTLGLSPFEQHLALLAVVLGHNFPFQLGWRGGNGLAAVYGGLLLADPALAGWLAVCFVAYLPVLAVAARFFHAPVKVHTPSKLVVLSAPLLALALGRPAAHVAVLVGLVVVIFWTIRQNFKNLAHLPAA